MRPGTTTRVVASAISIISLSMLGPSPAAAADPEVTDEPTTADTPTPTPTPTETEASAQTEGPETEAPAESESEEPGSEPDDIPYPPAEDAEGLADVKLPDRTVPVDPLPNPLNVPLPALDGPWPFPPGSANLLSLNLGKTGRVSPSDDRYDGSAVGLYFDTDLAGLLKLKSRKLGAVGMPDAGGITVRDQASVADVHQRISPTLPWLHVGGIKSQTFAVDLCCSRHPLAHATAKIARLEVMQLEADGIEVIANTRQDSVTGAFETTATTRMAWLKIGDNVYKNPNIAPNTTYDIAGLGKVVLNEQKITRIPGDRYAAKVNAIHITVNTAKLGLPVGTDIYIGSAEAVVHE